MDSATLLIDERPTYYHTQATLNDRSTVSLTIETETQSTQV